MQVGFSESTVTVDEDAGMVTLTIEINQNFWVTRPITVTGILNIRSCWSYKCS